VQKCPKTSKQTNKQTNKKIKKIKIQKQTQNSWTPSFSSGTITLRFSQPSILVKGCSAVHLISVNIGSEWQPDGQGLDFKAIQ
jgi:hypothetical protein